MPPLKRGRWTEDMMNPPKHPSVRRTEDPTPRTNTTLRDEICPIASPQHHGRSMTRDLAKVAN